MYTVQPHTLLKLPSRASPWLSLSTMSILQCLLGFYQPLSLSSGMHSKKSPLMAWSLTVHLSITKTTCFSSGAEFILHFIRVKFSQLVLILLSMILLTTFRSCLKQFECSEWATVRWINFPFVGSIRILLSQISLQFSSHS